MKKLATLLFTLVSLSVFGQLVGPVLPFQHWWNTTNNFGGPWTTPGMNFSYGLNGLSYTRNAITAGNPTKAMVFGDSIGGYPVAALNFLFAVNSTNGFQAGSDFANFPYFWPSNAGAALFNQVPGSPYRQEWFGNYYQPTNTSLTWVGTANANGFVYGDTLDFWFFSDPTNGIATIATSTDGTTFSTVMTVNQSIGPGGFRMTNVTVTAGSYMVKVTASGVCPYATVGLWASGSGGLRTAVNTWPGSDITELWGSGNRTISTMLTNYNPTLILFMFADPLSTKTNWLAWSNEVATYAPGADVVIIDHWLAGSDPTSFVGLQTGDNSFTQMIADRTNAAAYGWGLVDMLTAMGSWSNIVSRQLTNGDATGIHLGAAGQAVAGNLIINALGIPGMLQNAQAFVSIPQTTNTVQTWDTTFINKSGFNHFVMGASGSQDFGMWFSGAAPANQQFLDASGGGVVVGVGAGAFYVTPSIGGGGGANVTGAGVGNFTGVNDSGLTASALTMSDASKNLASVTVGSGLTLSGTTLSASGGGGTGISTNSGSGTNNTFTFPIIGNGTANSLAALDGLKQATNVGSLSGLAYVNGNLTTNFNLANAAIAAFSSTVVTQGNSFSTTVSNDWTVDATHRLIPKNSTASSVAALDGNSAVTNVGSLFGLAYVNGSLTTNFNFATLFANNLTFSGVNALSPFATGAFLTNHESLVTIVDGGMTNNGAFTNAGAADLLSTMIVGTNGPIHSTNEFQVAVQSSRKAFEVDTNGNTYVNNLLIVGSIKGVTDSSSAPAGSLGEYVSSLVAQGSAVSLTTATAKNVTTISLTAGDWDVGGNVSMAGATATITQSAAGINTTTAVIPTDGSELYSDAGVTLFSGTNSISLPRKRINVSSTTTVYLVGQCTFSAGTVTAFGSINARRVR